MKCFLLQAIAFHGILDVFDGLTDEQNIIYVIRLVFADKNERNAFLERTIIIIGIDKIFPRRSPFYAAGLAIERKYSRKTVS